MNHDDMSIGQSVGIAEISIEHPTSRTLKEGSLELTHISELWDLVKEERQYLVENLLHVSSISILAAKPKEGKTTLATELAYCVVEGESFLDNFPCKKGAVLYFALEEMRDYFVDNVKLRGMQRDSELYLQFHRASQDSISSLVNLCHRVKPALVIIDHLALFTEIEEVSDYNEITRVLSPLREVARETGTHILILHHMNKHAQGASGIFGSVALQGSVDTMMIIATKGELRCLSTIQRYGQNLTDVVITVNEQTRQVSSDCVTAEKSNDRNVTELASKILDIVSQANNPVTQSEMMKAVRGKASDKIAALRGLVEVGKILRSGSGTRGNEFHYSLHHTDFVVANSETVNGRNEGEFLT